ncbi:MAG: methylmalonyl-CoA mutase family protein [Candidatus Cloacimonadaceae bacterium]
MDKENHLTDELDLGKEFPLPTWEEWLKAVEQNLKGFPFSKAMITKTYEGIDLQPIYRYEDTENIPHLKSLPGQPYFQRGYYPAGHLPYGWKISQAIDISYPVAANRILLDELNRGLNSVNIKMASSAKCGKNFSASSFDEDGVCLSTLDDLANLLKDVDLSAVPLFLNGGYASLPILGALITFLKTNNFACEKLEGCLGFDFFAELVTKGESPLSKETAFQHIYLMTEWAEQNAPGLRTILINASVYGNAGCNAVQELAYALASLSEYMQMLTEKGISATKASSHLQLNLSIGPNLFLEIAKVRAARMLVTALLEAFGVPRENAEIWIHGVTAGFNKTYYDPYVNLLRTATESFSGIIGGLDSIEVLPFDCVVKPADEFSRRLARNQQIILQEEAHLDKVIDPAGGSYYVEVITSQLAEKAWLKLQEIEAGGGFYNTLKAGNIQSEIIKTANERIENTDRRKDIFVGVNMYANPEEQPLDYSPPDYESQNTLRLKNLQALLQKERKELPSLLAKIQAASNSAELIDDIAVAWQAQATLEEIFSALTQNEKREKITPLPNFRVTAHIENLRGKITACKQKNKKAVSIFLANMGPLSQHKARADFSVNFLQAGGFEVINNDGFATVQDAVDAVLKAKVKAVCICSTDDTYPELVPQLISQIRSKQSEMIFILAGYPPDMVETYKTQGVNCFIHLKANAYETLTEIANLMGVEL